MLVRLSALFAIVAVLAGCASIPPVTARYYLPKAETQLTVTQTLGCTGDGNHLVVATGVSAVTSYSADPDTAQELPLQKLGGTFVDADAALTFSSDGQLMSINGTNAGEGSTIVKNAVALSQAAGPLLVGLSAPSPGAPPKTLKNACAAIASFAASKPSGTAGKPASGDAGSPATVSLVYTLLIGYKNVDCPAPLTIAGGKSCLQVVRADGEAADPGLVEFTATPDTEGAVGALSGVDALQANLRPVLKLDGTAQLVRPSADVSDGASVTGPYLTLNKIATLGLEIDGLSSDFESLEGIETRATLLKGNVRIPVTNPQDVYKLPLPDPELFGKENFAVSLGGDGSIAKLEYGNVSGTGDMLSALATVAQAEAPETAAQRATAMQSQADLIYEQQRLVACQISPNTCASK
jgi:hypothetical protein